MKWEVIFQPNNLALYGEGILTTLALLFSSLAIGAVLALLFALALTGRSAVLRAAVGAYTYVVRGTPLLIQVYLIYYGLGQLEWIQARWDDIWPWTYFKEPFFCALLAFSLNTAGYTAEMLAGAIRETSAGEIEAAQAYGMGHWRTMWRVILPSALRRSLLAHVAEPDPWRGPDTLSVRSASRSCSTRRETNWVWRSTASRSARPRASAWAASKAAWIPRRRRN
jgi:arginine/ornithine transport system permease protein